VTLVLFAAVTFVLMGIEARRAAVNERAQRAAGGFEPAGDVYPLMRVAYPGAFLAMILEGAVRGGAPWSAAAVGAVVFALAKAIKWWAILTLDRAWTFRVIVVPQAPLVATGPYRFVRHPNYVGVIGELVGAALITGALIAGPIMMIGFAMLILKRIQIEMHALSRFAPSGRPER
jgi:methyltransferase